MAYYFKLPSIKESLIKLIWEDQNKIYEVIDGFFDDIKVGNKLEYEMVNINDRDPEAGKQSKV